MNPSQTAPLAVVDVHKGKVIIWPDGVTWGETTLLTREITGIRYGIVITKAAGLVSTNHRYSVALTGGGQTISISRYNLFVGGKVEDRFKELLDALWSPVIQPLIASLVDSIAGGPGFTIEEARVLATGRLKVDGAGLHWSPGRVLGVFERGGDFLHWRDYHGHSLHEGRVHLFSKASKKPWVSFSLLETWNAVCLGPALSAALKSGVVS